jgi:phosphatidylserine decarboxylase
VVQDANIIAHPVDGAISQLGKIDGDKLIQAKGHDYSLQALLGGLAETAAPYQNGEFACIYLAPKDYHRIHMPVAGTLREMIYVPGELFSVNPLTAANVPGLFARNERVVTIFDTEIGPMALVLVGATIVASIETVWAGTITPPTGKDIFRWSYPATGANAVHLEKGAEMGRFKLGSTVILAFAPDKIEFLPQQYPGAVTRMGEAFAAKKQ